MIWYEHAASFPLLPQQLQQAVASARRLFDDCESITSNLPAQLQLQMCFDGCTLPSWWRGEVVQSGCGRPLRGSLLQPSVSNCHAAAGNTLCACSIICRGCECAFLAAASAVDRFEAMVLWCWWMSEPKPAKEAEVLPWLGGHHATPVMPHCSIMSLQRMEMLRRSSETTSHDWQ